MSKPAKTRRWIVIVGFAVSAALLTATVARLDGHAVLQSLRNAKLWPWLPLGVTSYMTGHVLRGIRCSLLAGSQSNLSWLSATNIVVVGYAANNILPARLGEFVRAGMLAERTGMPILQALTLTFLERVLDAMGILVIFAMARTVVPLTGWLASAGDLVVPVCGLALSGVAALVIFPHVILSITTRLANLVIPKHRDGLIGIVSNVTSAVSYLRRPVDALRVLVLTLIIWLFEAGLFALLLPAFGITARYAWACLIMSVTNLGILLPSSPGFVGPFHYFCMQTLQQLGVDGSVGMSYAVLVHAGFFVPVTLFGVIATSWYGIQIGRTADAARQAKSLPVYDDHAVSLKRIAQVRRASDSEPAPPFVRAIVEAFIPWEIVDLDTANRRQVLNDVVAFVGDSIDALPARLKILHTIGMAGFRVIVGLLTWRSFLHLELHRRNRIVEAWAWGRIGLARQLFRLVRSTALLAFHDHPIVVRAIMADSRKTSDVVALRVVS